MRLHFRLSPNTVPVSFDHLPQLTGVLHKWLGPNNVHDGLSLYSFGWLRGATRVGNGLQFPGGAEWSVSFLSDELSDTLRAGVRRDPSLFAGMQAYEIREQITPGFGPAERFWIDGAVLTRCNRDDGGRDHLTYQDERSDGTLTRTLRRRLTEAGMTGSDLDAVVRFDRGFGKARTKMITLKGTRYRTSECPVIVEGTPESVRTAWLVGVGELTGMGLGALK